MFAKPTKEDFMRMLAGLVEEARSAAAPKAQAVQRQFAGAGHNAGYPNALIQAVDPVHRECVLRAMDLIRTYADRSDIPFDDLCQTAERFLKTHVSGMSSYAEQAAAVHHGSAPPGWVLTWRGHFERQIEDAVRDLRVGFIGGRSVPMPVADTVQAKALRLLEFLYEHTRRGEAPIMLDSPMDERQGAALKLSTDDVRAAWHYLKGKGLIETFRLEYAARINAHGIDAVENARMHPDKPTSPFPGVTHNNIITIHRMIGSSMPIQQAGHHSSQTQTSTNTSYTAHEVNDLRRLVEIFEKHIDELTLNAPARKRALSQVATIKAQLDSDPPNPVIVKEAGLSLKNIAENAIGSVIGSGVTAGLADPTAWQWALDALHRLF